MFKRLLKSTAVLLALVCSGPLFGQARDYIFSVSTSTYTPLGGTAIPVDILADTRSDTVAIGFDFYFEGQAYDSASVASDGFLSFIVGASSFLTNDLDNGSSIRRPLVAPLWDDHDGRANASAAAYEVSGTAPNRVFTFEWSNWEWRYNSTDSVVSFQVKLYETTNEIEFHYRWECSSCANSPSASIGLSGATSFLSVTGVGTGSPSASSITEDNSIDTIVTDQVFKFTPSTCPSPTLLSFTNVEKDSITVNWTGTGTGPWYIYWGPAGFDQATPGVSLDTSTTTSFIAHGLSHSTEYSFFIKEDCGGGDTSKYAGPFYQTTIYAPPYLETFTNGYPGADYTEAAGLIANPTSFTSTTSSLWKEDGFSNSGTTGAVSLNIYGTSRKEWFFGPSIDLGDGSTIYQFEMDVAVTNWNNATADAMGPDDSVLVVISTDNGATWNKSNTILTLTESNTIPNGAGAHYIASLAGYSGLVKFGVYAQSTQSNTDYDFHVDNIAINPQPPCPLPGMLQSTVYGLDSVIVVWNSTNSNFNVEYGIAPANPGVGTNTVAVTDTFVVLKGLQTGAAYDIYVQTDCSTGAGGTSGFVSASFAVPCIATAPYLENFDGATWKIGTSGGSGDTIDGCWTRNSNTGYKWSVFNGSTLTANTGPDKDHTSGTGNFLFTESSSTSPSLAQLESPYIDISSLTNPYVSFWYHRYGSASSMGDMVLEVNDGTGWDTVLTLTGLVQTSTTNPFVEIGADLSAYADTVQIRFTAEEKACCTGDMAIDDFKVDEAPSCLPILNLTADGIVDSAATFRWDGTTTATSYEVWFGPQGFYQGTATVGGTKVIAQYDSLLVDTLSDLTCYEFVVRGICGPGDTTAYAGPYSFCTPPSCPQPTALGVDPVSITHNSADVYWTTGGSSDFNIEYGPIGFARGSGTSMNVTNDTVSLSSLASGTGYEFYVRDSCGQGDVSLWSGPFSFVTAFTTNYLQDFSSSTPFAWLEADGRLRANTTFTSSSSSWLNDQFGNVGTNNSQRVNIFTVDQYEWLISPSIYLDPAISNLQMEFDVAVTDYANAAQGYFGTDDSLVVVISTDNGATWSSANAIWYADATDTLDAAGEHVIVPLTGYSGYVRFGVYAGSAINDAPDNDWFIDNFEVRTPRACANPTAININEIKTDSALVSWTAGTPGFVGASVIYTQGNQPASAGTVISATNDSVYLSGLSAATEYCVYIVEQCANGFSDTIGPVCFVTECLSFTAPYSEGFEGATVSCWSNELVTGTKLWTVGTGSSGGAISAAHSGLLNARFTSSSGGPHITKLVSPVIDASMLTSTELEFWFAQEDWFSDQNFLNVYYRDNASAPWTHVWSDSTNVITWTKVNVMIPSTSATLQIAFEGVDEFGRANVIDDVFVGQATTCPTPSNVAVANASCDSVEVSWTSDATATSSYVEYGAKGFALGSGTVIANATSPQTINGLALNTEYDVYVVDSCSADQSNPSGVTTFKTDSVGPVHASFTAMQTSASLTDGMVDVDASASTGDGLTYTWDFGNSTTGSGATTQGTYTANGTYSIVLTVTDRCGNTDDTTVVVTVAEISIVENDYNAGIEMYPNPNNGTFKVNVTDGSGAYTIEVIDLSGRVIYHKANIATGTAHEVQLQNKAKGVYMVRLKGKGLNVTQRIVID